MKYILVEDREGLHPDGYSFIVDADYVFEYDNVNRAYVTWLNAYDGEPGDDVIAVNPKFTREEMRDLVERGKAEPIKKKKEDSKVFIRVTEHHIKDQFGNERKMCFLDMTDVFNILRVPDGRKKLLDFIEKKLSEKERGNDEE